MPSNATHMNYLIYSEKHSVTQYDGHAVWWKPNGCGYTKDINAAGRYTLEEAEAQCGDAAFRSSHPVREDEVLKVSELKCGKWSVRNILGIRSDIYA